ncbi:MAG: TSUP family transporter [Clostridia bacterium]|nr:TSUP family transporter [Clostridia bacterium]
MKYNHSNNSNNNLILIFVGIAIGLVNGFFGGGGGMICVPLLLMLGLDNRHAQATAIMVMLPISIASGVVYYTNGNLDWNIIVFVGVGSVLGGVLGALLLKKLSNLTLQYIFALAILFAGIKMIMG